MSVPHDDLVRSIRLYLSEVGALSIKIDTPGLLFDKRGTPVKIGTKGVLDINACLKGRFLAIDAKIGRDRLSPTQINFTASVERAGGIAFAAYSIEDVANRLRMEGLL
jgi:hypothetical protein